jgi:mono/diheme cytochrome c family protein
MADEPRFEPMEPTPFFADGRSARPLPAGTVARDFLRDDELLYKGSEAGRFAERFPFPVTAQVLARGRERFDIYCAVCHDRTGSGTGMAVRRGFPAPPSFHIQRLREAPPGRIFDVVTHGFGKMYPYGDRVEPADRWAIAAYVRALQLSQGARLGDVPPGLRAGLENGR